MDEVLLLLGGDLGDVVSAQERAIADIGSRIGAVLARSRAHWTEPWGFAGGNLFLNTAILVSTPLSPEAVMAQCLAIEKELGRERDGGTQPRSRTIDIDILLIADRVVEVPGLMVPHPRMYQRAFALAPAADIAPAWLHPLLGRTVLELLDDLHAPSAA